MKKLQIEEQDTLNPRETVCEFTVDSSNTTHYGSDLLEDNFSSFDKKNLSKEQIISFGNQSFPYLTGLNSNDLSDFAEKLEDLAADQYVIITGIGVPPAVLNPYLLLCFSIAKTNIVTINDVETHKTLYDLAEVANAAVGFGITRRSVIVAVGGGIVGNLAGLLTSLIFRGIRLVHAPTTFLAMSDSVLSLKQAVNGKWGKNHFGTFYTPELVLSYLPSLEHLPTEQIQSSLNESIKNTLAISPDQIPYFQKNLNPQGIYSEAQLEQFLMYSISSKTSVMKEDQNERNEALVLEYGHTVGHALELLSHDNLPHGFAIGLGMLVAANISRKMENLTENELALHYELLEKNGAPTSFPDDITTDRILEVILKDNKRGYLPGTTQNIDMIILKSLSVPCYTGNKPLISIPIVEITAQLNDFSISSDLAIKG